MREENPISLRLQELLEQWLAATSLPAVRLLCWIASDDEAHAIDAFVSQECAPDTANLPDLFVQLTTPFLAQPGHGYRLSTELLAQYDEARAEPVQTSAEPVQGAWQCGASTDCSDAQTFVRLLESFAAHHLPPGSSGRLAVWLAPSEVSRPDAYMLWLQRVVRLAPAQLCFLAVDALDAPHYAPLAEVESERVVRRACQLSLAAASGEALQAASTAGPDARFRAAQAACSESLAAGDAAAADTHARAALALATQQGWPQLAAVVQMMLAASYTAASKPHDALRAYAEAERLGSERERQENDATATAADGDGVERLACMLRLHARLGQGGILLGQRSFNIGAVVYEEAASLARKCADARLELDALRLASLCRAELGEARSAWQLGMQGMQLGIAMDDETRKSSSLPYLADQLVRFTRQHGAYAAHRKPLEAQLDKLLGADRVR